MSLLYQQPIPALEAWIKPLCESLHLRVLPHHIHEILASCLLYHFIFKFFSPSFSSLFISNSYSKLSGRNKLRWDMHIVSLLQSTALTILSIYVLVVDDERRNMSWEERLWGYSVSGASLQALACGYFLFDFLATLWYIEVFGTPMLVHALGCLVIFTISFRPICNYYACAFTILELSTPFLNLHWFFDKVGMTGSRAQLYNGLILLATFFFSRLVWGMYAAMNIYRDVFRAFISSTDLRILSNKENLRYEPERSLPLWVIITCTSSHVALQVLNVYWFWKMIAAIRKRFNNKIDKSLEKWD